MTSMLVVAVTLVVLISGCGPATPTAAPTVSGSSSATAPAGPRQEYRTVATVLEVGATGPQLCYAVAASYPPQCTGSEIVGWDWDAVAEEESASGTTWVEALVTGTWDGERFTLTRPAEPASAWSEPPLDPDEFAPGCDDPEVMDPSAGRLGVDAATARLEGAGVSAVWVSDPSGSWDGPFVLTVVVSPGRGDEIAELVRRNYAGALCVVEHDQPTEAELAAVQEQVSAVGGDTPLGPQLGSALDTRRGVVLVQVMVADEEAKAFAARRWDGLVELEPMLIPVS